MNLTPDQFAGVIRALLAGLGGAAVVAGKADPVAVETVAGAASVLGAAAWSVWSKKR
jgi:hypothetical protein